MRCEYQQELYLTQVRRNEIVRHTVGFLNAGTLPVSAYIALKNKTINKMTKRKRKEKKKDQKMNK